MSATRWFSLRRRLTLWLLGGFTVGWGMLLALSYADAHHEIDELFDAQLVQSAQSLLALRGVEGDDDDDDHAPPPPVRHRYQAALEFQLWDHHDRLLLRSPGAPAIALATGDGFSDGAEGWRYYAQWDARGRRRAIVGEHHQRRVALARHIAVRLLAPALFGLPLLVGWLWLATRRGLRPLDALAREVASRDPQRLEALAPSTAPLEVKPLVEALNGLFARVTRVLDNERRFTADAAHELRTPLAAVATQTQVAARARDAAERDRALEQIAAASRRASHLVEQLLTLARLDADTPMALAETDLAALAAAVCADAGAAALAKDIALELDAAAPVPFAGHPALLAVLLRNLVDNAVRYTPAGGRVAVAVQAQPDGVLLSVADSGPGIDPAVRATLPRRFLRLAGQDAVGSGLGLSIAARIAELHGGSLALGDGIGEPGLGVRVSLPRAVSPRL